MSNNFTISSQYNPTINRKIQCAAFDVNAFENYIINSKAIYRIMSIRARYRLFDRNTNVSFRLLKFVKYNHRFRNRSAISPIVCVNHVVSNEEISLFILFILFFFCPCGIYGYLGYISMHSFLIFIFAKTLLLGLSIFVK